MRAAGVISPALPNLRGKRPPLVAIGLMVLLALAQPLRADLTRARAEHNLEKRSGLALQNAATACRNARTAYEKGEIDQVVAGAAEIEESVRLAYDSLVATGKDPRKSPKWFKKAEIDTRDLLRKIEALQQQMSFDDRRHLEGVKATVQHIHDELLLGLMQGKKKA